MEVCKLKSCARQLQALLFVHFPKVSNKELQEVAQAYATECIWGHNPNRSLQAPSFEHVGEDLYITTAPDSDVDYKAAVQSWYNEVADYDYATGQCNPGKVCGHYTQVRIHLLQTMTQVNSCFLQVVWATSKYVGCGAHRCPTVEGLPYTDLLLVVCNYGPG